MKKGIAVALILVLLAALAVGGWILYDNNVDRSGWVEKGGTMQYRDFHGKPVHGWQELEGKTYYFDLDNAMVTGWQTIGNVDYYFESNGAMVTGWQTIDQDRYYFSPEGKLQTQWLELEGSRYYLGDDGKMASFWQELEGKRCYFGEDGALRTGWQEVDGIRCYFTQDGALLTGWQDIEGERYLLDENGSPLIGEQQVEGKTYLFDEEGKMAVGWVEDRYFQEDGTMAVGWLDNRYFREDGTVALGLQKIGDTSYYFSEDGTFHTGWLEQGEYRYYFFEDGTMAVGPQEIDGKTYHFSPGGIQIWLVNPWNELHEDYEVELVKVEGGYNLAAICADAFADMMADCRAAGHNPQMISGHRTYWDQYALYQQKIQEYGLATAKEIVARPNTSEHQLGLAVDIVIPGSQNLNREQSKSAMQQWLMANCWDYGFILRYPDDTTEITGIMYEPWHYRYVGLEVAKELQALGITLEEYLGAVVTAEP